MARGQRLTPRPRPRAAKGEDSDRPPAESVRGSSRRELGKVIGNGIIGDRPIVEAEVSDALAVGRPLIGARAWIDPQALPHKPNRAGRCKGVAAVVSEPADSRRLDFHHVKIMLLNECDRSPNGEKVAGTSFSAPSSSRPLQSGRLGIENPQVLSTAKQNRIAMRRPLVGTESRLLPGRRWIEDDDSSVGLDIVGAKCRSPCVPGAGRTKVNCCRRASNSDPS